MRPLFILSCVLNCFLGLTSAGDDVILMEPYDPQKVGGMWYVHQRNQRLTDKTQGGSCLKVNIEHDASGTDVYKMDVTWKDPNIGDLDATLNVVDDKTHPARYFFQMDEHKIALAVLGTDYDNWVVAYGMLGLRDSYFVAFRKLPPNDAYMAEATKILEKNKVSKDFAIMDHSSC